MIENRNNNSLGDGNGVDCDGWVYEGCIVTMVSVKRRGW